MISFNPKPNPRLIQQISFVERFLGSWQHISLTPAIASVELNTQAITQGVNAILALDTTSPIVFYPQLKTENSPPKNLTPQEALVFAHNHNFEFSLLGIDHLFEVILCLDSHQQKTLLNYPIKNELTKKNFRNSSSYFYAPADTLQSNYEIVFPTVTSFLIEQRLKELVDWTKNELKQSTHHPLIIIGTFQLLFLQIHPFYTANHRLSLLIIWHLLINQGFDFIRYSHFAPHFTINIKGYFSALRQAEKSALTSWSTLNIWLEYFFEALVHSCQSLDTITSRNSKFLRLTSVQKRILEVIRSNGFASREKIVTDTKISLSTVKYNLSILTENGQLKREGGGRSTSYALL